MRVTLNGAAIEVDSHTIAALVAARANPFVAVAKNGTFVPRSRWADTAIDEGDALELLAPMTGG